MELNSQRKKVIMESMVQAVIPILTLTMVEITVESSSKEKESFKSELSQAREKSGKGQYSSRQNLSIILGMAQAGIATSCILFIKNSSDQGGLTKTGNNFNYLKYLRSPFEISNKKDDTSNATQSSWKRRTTTLSFYQRNLDRRLSTPREYDDPYKKMRSTFASSMRSSSRVK